MGAGCSKVEDSVCGRRKSTVFQSCLKGFSCSAHSFHGRDQRKERCGIRWRPFRRHAKRQPDGVKCHSCVKGDGLRSIPTTEINSGVGFDGWVQENAPSTEFVDESNSGRFPSTTEPLASSNRLSRRLNVIPDHGRAVLNKETSPGSSEACSVLSNGPEISSSFAACREGGLESESGVLPNDNSCSLSTFPLVEPSNGVFRDVDSSCAEPQFANSASVVQERGPVLATAQDREGHGSIGLSETSRSGSSLGHLGTTSGEQRRPCRRTGTLEAAGDGIQFGRTLSVGRLRDRVLRRNASSRGSFNHVANDDMSRDVRQGTVRQILDHATEEIINQRAENPQTSSNYNVINADSSVRSINNGHQFRLNNQQAGADANNNTPPLHRSTFIERRQRVRSQVHALQRLGSRFENLVGHDRSCILSGHYRSGRCRCRTGTRAENSEDEPSTRTSISRIVMLAEALFEVLDEIHQQSVVSSSRPSVSSFGSVPAPKEDVERLPLKLYTRSGIKNEEAAQCHICLVEYEEGDWMRILRCQHEFHQSCVDKWLKEVHRVCPLCRTNVCLSDSLPLE
ncbi:uncharacterized protein LOC116252288 [Nymphaea colorata]|nr:uncharacterized protein LOC116252288 [Nymphaea colorata]